MLKVHHLGISQSERIIWACEELDVEYELVKHARDPETNFAPAAFADLHPMKIAPVIEDGSLCLGESAAIIEYIDHKYGNDKLCVSKNSDNFADYLYWFHFSNATFVPAAMITLVAQMAGAGSDDPTVRHLQDRERRCYEMVETWLGNNEFFAGDTFSAADVMMGFPLTRMRSFIPHDLSNSPNTLSYLKRMGDRPGFKAMVQKGDPEAPPLLT